MKNLRNDINELIDWYEKYRPTAGQEIPVNATMKEICKELFPMMQSPKKGEAWPKSIQYRNRELIAVKVAAK